MLSVNINKIATLRNSRGGNTPHLVKIVQDIVKFGAQGITVHPRPDERHITYQDVRELSKILTVEFNVEGYPSDNFLRLIDQVRPNQITLVPDKPRALTSDSGWDFHNIEHKRVLTTAIQFIKKINRRVSLFINPNSEDVESATIMGSDRIELYTGPYAQGFENLKVLDRYITSARFANKLGIGINAGHDLNLKNLKNFVRSVKPIKEVSIGHALISDALYYGLEKTIKLYKNLLKEK